MAGRGRGRSRGRGAPVGQPEEQAPPAPVQPQQPAAAAAPPVSRGRGRGRGASPAVAPSAAGDSVSAAAMSGAVAGQFDNTSAGRGRGRGALPEGAADGSYRPRGGAGVGNGKNGGAEGPNGLAEKLEGLRVQGGAGGERPPRRMHRNDEENLSSGHCEGFKINVQSIKGAPVNLVANAVTLYPPQNMTKPAAYMYHVEFNPQLDGKKLRIAIIKSNHDKLGGKYILYDGGSAMFTGTPVGDNGRVEFDHTTHKGELIHVVCTQRSEVFAGSSEHLRIAGVLMKKGLTTLGYTPFGRHHFDAQMKIDMKNGFELLPGYQTGVNKYEGGLLLVADTCFKMLAVRTVYQDLLQIHQESRGNTEVFQQQALNKIVGRIVFTPYNQKRHRVDDINFDASPLDEFEKKGEKISFMAYYQQMYGIEVKDQKQPLLLSQPKERERRQGMTQPILLIPELCHVTGISDEQRADFRFTKAMGEFTKQGPDVKARNLMGLVQRFTKDENIRENFAFWNMRFDTQLVQFQGRRLQSPNIVFQDAVDYNKNSADFGSVLKNCRFRSPVNVTDYAVFYIKQNEQIAGTLNEKLHQAGRGFGMAFGNCRAKLVNSPRSEDWIQTLKATMTEANGQMKLAIFVLPDNRADRYNSIKKVCYIEQPIPSQCVLMKTLSKPQGLMSVVSKLAMQINAKLGGEPWITDFKLPGLMVVGMDVYHAGKNKTKSAIGFVGSLNDSLSRFYSRAYINNEEDVHVLEPALTSLLNRYKAVNNVYPKYIAMFRDGVGEGQLGKVQENELKAFQNVIANLQCNSKLCFVVVTKRIMQRFFQSGGRGLDNPMPGTVVFDTLTKENRFDFFLAPTSSRQGTVTPTHYNVIYDDTPFWQDNGRLMDLSFHLCHMYFNWTGAIRVPSVCQYAHKLAALCGDSLANVAPTPHLADTLFYL